MSGIDELSVGLIIMTILKTILLLVASNVFMTFAWYAHLKELSTKPLIVAITLSWGIAFFEYALQVPANRIGYGTLTLPQLKIIQEVVSLSVFVPFAVLYMRIPISWNYFYAGLCLAGAVYFIFKPQSQTAEKGAAGQSVTRFVSESEGGDRPQP